MQQSDLAGLHDPKEGVQESRNQGCCPKGHCFRHPVHSCHNEHVGTRGFLRGQSTEHECCCPTPCCGECCELTHSILQTVGAWVWKNLKGLHWDLQKWETLGVKSWLPSEKTVSEDDANGSFGISLFISKIMASGAFAICLLSIIQYLPSIQP